MIRALEASDLRPVIDRHFPLEELREAGYGPDAVGSALPRIMRILQAEDVRIEAGRVLSRKEREFVRVQLEMGVDVSEIVAGLKR